MSINFNVNNITNLGAILKSNKAEDDKLTEQEKQFLKQYGITSDEDLAFVKYQLKNIGAEASQERELVYDAIEEFLKAIQDKAGSNKKNVRAAIMEVLNKLTPDSSLKDLCTLFNNKLEELAKNNTQQDNVPTVKGAKAETKTEAQVADLVNQFVRCKINPEEFLASISATEGVKGLKTTSEHGIYQTRFVFENKQYVIYYNASNIQIPDVKLPEQVNASDIPEAEVVTDKGEFIPNQTSQVQTGGVKLDPYITDSVIESDMKLLNDVVNSIVNRLNYSPEVKNYIKERTMQSCEIYIKAGELKDLKGNDRKLKLEAYANKMAQYHYNYPETADAVKDRAKSNVPRDLISNIDSYISDPYEFFSTVFGDTFGNTLNGHILDMDSSVLDKAENICKAALIKFKSGEFSQDQMLNKIMSDIEALIKNVKDNPENRMFTLLELKQAGFSSEEIEKMYSGSTYNNSGDYYKKPECFKSLNITTVDELKNAYANGPYNYRDYKPFEEVCLKYGIDISKYVIFNNKDINDFNTTYTLNLDAIRRDFNDPTVQTPQNFADAIVNYMEQMPKAPEVNNAEDTYDVEMQEKAQIIEDFFKKLGCTMKISSVIYEGPNTGYGLGVDANGQSLYSMNQMGSSALRIDIQFPFQIRWGSLPGQHEKDTSGKYGYLKECMFITNDDTIESIMAKCNRIKEFFDM